MVGRMVLDRVSVMAQSFTQRNRARERFVTRCGWFAWVVVLVGCMGPVEPVSHLQGSGLDEPFPDASGAALRGEWGRLPYDIPRAIQKAHWGKLSVDAVSSPRGQVVRAGALLPDGREAAVVAWPMEQGGVYVAVRVGPFGDREQEKAFLNSLQAVLSGKISRRQRFDQSLPKP